MVILMNKDNEFLQEIKSIMYKIISLDCGVYVDDWDEFLVCALICRQCRRPWNNSRTECFFCGTHSFHTYKCLDCGKYCKLTLSTKKCEGCGSKKLVKTCVNPKCISNTNSRLSNFVNKKGGVFEKDKAASMLNEMRCKICGCKTSIYEARRFKIVKNIDESCDVVDVVYVKKEGPKKYIAKYNGITKYYEIIEEIIQDVIGIGCELS